jgi:2-oxoglutarate ferredoxin oxidoreductase subunit beta
MTELGYPNNECLEQSGYESPEESDWLTGLHPMDDLLRAERLPHIWCQGCGLGTALTTFISAIQWLEKNRGWDLDKISVVSGIGCTGRVAGYLRLDSFHTTHGRALPFATGLKLANTDLKVVVISGDGDIAGIGGNHFIHAARRNIDMTAIVMNNRIYGMTGGQFSPLSGVGVQATTAPYATIDKSFDVVQLSQAAGATFVARTTTYHVQQMAKIIEQAILHQGFSVVEVLTQCPTYFGRKNRAGSAVDMINWYKENTTSIGSKGKQENPDLIERGIFVQREEPEYCNEYAQITQQAMGGSK